MTDALGIEVAVRGSPDESARMTEVSTRAVFADE
jgi:hypothetical protein